MRRNLRGYITMMVLMLAVFGGLVILALVENQIGQAEVFKAHDVGQQTWTERVVLARLVKTSILTYLENVPDQPAGHSMQAISSAVNQTLSGWLGTTRTGMYALASVPAFQQANLYQRPSGTVAPSSSTATIAGVAANQQSQATRYANAPVITTHALNTTVDAIQPADFGNPAVAGFVPVPTTAVDNTSRPVQVGTGRASATFIGNGPVSMLGTIAVPLNRVDPANANNTKVLTVFADIWRVPVTNFNFVVYGLPASGPGATPSDRVPHFAPNWGSGSNGVQFAANVKPMIMTLVDGGPRTLPIDSNAERSRGLDPTIVDSVMGVSAGGTSADPKARWAFTYRDDTGFCWNTYETIMDMRPTGLIRKILRTAKLQGNACDFSLNMGGFDPLGALHPGDAINHPFISLAWDTSTSPAQISGTTINLAGVPDGPTPIEVAVVDAYGGRVVTIAGDSDVSAMSKQPVVIVIRNMTDPAATGGPVRTQVRFVGAANLRPVLIYVCQGNVTFDSACSDVSGAMILDPWTTAVFPATTRWHGHLSLYCATDWPSTFPGTPGPRCPEIYFDANVERALAPVAPASVTVTTRFR